MTVPVEIPGRVPDMGLVSKERLGSSRLSTRFLGHEHVQGLKWFFPPLQPGLWWNVRFDERDLWVTYLVHVSWFRTHSKGNRTWDVPVLKDVKYKILKPLLPSFHLVGTGLGVSEGGNSRHYSTSSVHRWTSRLSGNKSNPGPSSLDSAPRLVAWLHQP